MPEVEPAHVNSSDAPAAGSADALAARSADVEGTVHVPGVTAPIRVALACVYCHDRLPCADVVFCAACLAPHHDDCFVAHGRCAAPGCDESRTVRPGEPPPATPRARESPAPPPASRWPLLALNLALWALAAGLFAALERPASGFGFDAPGASDVLDRALVGLVKDLGPWVVPAGGADGGTPLVPFEVVARLARGRAKDDMARQAIDHAGRVLVSTVPAGDLVSGGSGLPRRPRSWRGWSPSGTDRPDPDEQLVLRLRDVTLAEAAYELETALHHLVYVPSPRAGRRRIDLVLGPVPRSRALGAFAAAVGAWSWPGVDDALVEPRHDATVTTHELPLATWNGALAYLGGYELAQVPASRALVRVPRTRKAWAWGEALVEASTARGCVVERRGARVRVLAPAGAGVEPTPPRVVEHALPDGRRLRLPPLTLTIVEHEPDDRALAALGSQLFSPGKVVSLEAEGLPNTALRMIAVEPGQVVFETVEPLPARFSVSFRD